MFAYCTTTLCAGNSSAVSLLKLPLLFLNRASQILAVPVEESFVYKYGGKSVLIAVALIMATLFFSWGSLLKLWQRFNKRDFLRVTPSPTYPGNLAPRGDVLDHFWLLFRAESTTDLQWFQALLCRWLSKGFLVLQPDENDPTGSPLLHFHRPDSPGAFLFPEEAELFDYCLSLADGGSTIAHSQFLTGVGYYGSELLNWSRNVHLRGWQSCQQHGLAGRSLRGRRVLSSKGRQELQRLLDLRAYFTRSLNESGQLISGGDFWDAYLFYAFLFDTAEENREALEHSYPGGNVAFHALWLNCIAVHRYSELFFATLSNEMALAFTGHSRYSYIPGDMNIMRMIYDDRIPKDDSDTQLPP